MVAPVGLSYSQKHLQVNTPVVRLDDPEHELAIYASGDWHGWRSKAATKEPWTFDWLKTIGTGVFYDVGACVGSYSLMAAARGATVIAFEPVPWNYAECVANVYLNSLENRIAVLPVAVGAEDGTAIIKHPGGPTPGFGEGGRRTWTPTWDLRIPMVRLGDPSLPKPTHVKIDVEGQEIDVLRGMDFDGVESLIVELKDQDNEADAFVILQAHGFESTWHGGERTEKQRTHIFRRKSC